MNKTELAADKLASFCALYASLQGTSLECSAEFCAAVEDVLCLLALAKTATGLHRAYLNEKAWDAGQATESYFTAYWVSTQF